MNTCEGEELFKDGVDTRKNKYDITINKPKTKFRGAFLSVQGCSRTVAQGCTGEDKKMLL